MLLFSLLAIPALSFLLFAGLKKVPVLVRPAEFWILQLLGIVCASAYCIIDVFFVSKNIWFVYGFGARFFSPLFFEMILPLLVSVAVFFLFIRGSVQYKIGSFPLFLLGFYVVFLPCKLLSYGSGYPFFVVFIKPLLFVCMLYNLLSFLPAFLRLLQKKNIKLLLVFIFTGLCLIMLPAFTEAVWFMKSTLPLWLLPFCFSAASLFALPKILYVRI